MIQSDSVIKHILYKEEDLRKNLEKAGLEELCDLVYQQVRECLELQYREDPESLPRRALIERVQGLDLEEECAIQQAKLNGIIKAVHIELPPIHAYSPPIRFMLTRAAVIQSLFKDTHYVFIHGQSPEWAIIPHLISHIRQALGQEVPPDYEFVRSSHIIDSSVKIEDAIPCEEGIDDHHPKVRQYFISSDLGFCHEELGESASYFLNYQSIKLLSKALDSPDLIPEVQELQPNATESLWPNVKRTFEQAIVYAKNNKPPTKDLVVFCIPKTVVTTSVYRAHSMGRPCQCIPKEKAIDAMDAIQAGRLTAEYQCKDEDPHPQFRIFAPSLKHENGSYIYRIEASKTLGSKLCQAAKECVESITGNNLNTHNVDSEKSDQGGNAGGGAAAGNG